MKNLVKKINHYMDQGTYSDAINLIKDFDGYGNYPFLNRYLDYCSRKLSGDFVENNLNELDNFDRDCICLNTTIKELDKVEKLFKVWLKFHEKRDGEKVKYFSNLVVAFDVHNTESVSSLKCLIEKYKVDQIFYRIHIIDIAIPVDFNFYKRVDDGSLDLKKFIYGYKSGPNYQFYALMKRLITDGYRNVYVCETDTFPVRADWANCLMKEAASQNDFWVLGSPFLGRSKLDPSLALHINGSAIYALQSKGFIDFLSRWESVLLNLVQEIPYVAYDWAMDYYFYNEISAKNWGKLNYIDFHEQIKFKKMCRYTDLIINLAGEAERSGEGRYAIYEILINHPHACILHGDYFYDELILH
jgi:hypothetical protein